SPAGADRGLAGDLQAARLGVREPAADDGNPQPGIIGSGQGQTRPLAQRPAERTSEAAGAATSPPAAAASISSTPIASLAPLAAAKAANQASLRCCGCWAFSSRGRGPSSAVPVLPATWASGIAPAVPVPPVTTPIISSVSSPAILGDITRTGFATGRS